MVDDYIAGCYSNIIVKVYCRPVFVEVSSVCIGNYKESNGDHNGDHGDHKGNNRCITAAYTLRTIHIGYDSRCKYHHINSTPMINAARQHDSSAAAF